MQSTQVETPSTFWSGMTRLVEGPIGWLVTLIVIPALLAAMLLLPPINSDQLPTSTDLHAH